MRTRFGFGVAVAYLAAFASITGMTFRDIATHTGTLWAIVFVLIASAAIYWVSRQLLLFSSLTTRDENIAISKHLLGTAQSNITIIGGDISWVPDLSSDIRDATQVRGKTVNVFCRPPRFRQQRDYVNQLIEGCGATVMYFSKGAEPTTRAIVKDLENPEILEFARVGTANRPPILASWLKRALRYAPQPASSKSEDIYFAHRYGAESSEAHKACDLVKLLEQSARSASVASKYEFGDLRKTLVSCVSQYANANVHLSRIDVSRLHPICSYLDADRLERVLQLARMFDDEGFECFEPVSILSASRRKIISPPIVEKIGDRYFIIDGTHRIFAAKSFGLEEVWVIVVDNPAEDLPSTPRTWTDVTVTSQVAGHRTWNGIRTSMILI